MDFDAILKMIREQNPKMPFKEAQKKASEKYNQLKLAREELSKDKPSSLKVTVPIPDDSPLSTKKKAGTKDEKVTTQQTAASKLVEGISVDELFEAEKSIRREGCSRNSITIHGSRVIPKGKIVVHGKEGPNKLVTWEDDEGNALPISGYFKVFLT